MIHIQQRFSVLNSVCEYIAVIEYVQIFAVDL